MQLNKSYYITLDSLVLTQSLITCNFDGNMSMLMVIGPTMF